MTLGPIAKRLEDKVKRYNEGYGKVFFEDLWCLVVDYLSINIRKGKPILIPGLGKFAFVRNNMEIGTHGTKQFKKLCVVFENKFLQHHGLRGERIHPENDVPVTEISSLWMARQLRTNVGVVKFGLKVLIQEFGELAKNNLNLKVGELGTISSSFGKIKFVPGPRYQKNKIHRFMVPYEHNNGPRKYSGHKEIFTVNKLKTQRKLSDSNQYQNISRTRLLPKSPSRPVSAFVRKPLPPLDPALSTFFESGL